MLDQFIGQTLDDKYRIEEIVRESDLGKTYRATHVLMDKTVFIKILSPALAVDNNIVRRFSSEAKTVSHISHPNVLNITDFGSDVRSGTVYLVLESVEGETLKETIAREGAFSLERAVNIARQIAAALSAAHSKDVIHSHLNAENILLTATSSDADIVKVLDFGAAKLEENNSFDEEETALADLEYLAPEQIASVSEADTRSDIYSLGVIFYEMLAGEVPFQAENATDLMLKQAEEPPAPLSAFRSDLPAGIEPVILQALAKNPEMRYQTANEFAGDLIRASYSGEAKTLAATAADGSNNIWKTISIVLIGISVLAIGLIYATSVKQTDPTTMQVDANGQPVQPINPATGLNEQGLANMSQFSTEMLANSNGMVPQVMPGGDGYDPWARGVQPPAGAPPTYIGPGGQVITIPNDGSGSQFMPQDGNGYILVPVPQTNSNVNIQPSPTPKPKTTPANTSATPNPNQTPTTTNPTTEPKATPAPKQTPKEQPKNSPTSNEKRAQSGKQQDTD